MDTPPPEYNSCKTHSVYPSRDDLQSSLRKERWALLLALATMLCMSFTIFFAYNGSKGHPISNHFIFSNPERSILALNILSQITIFLFAELTLSVLESTRWALASSSNGTPALTFLALSRATNAVGVLCILLGAGDRKLGRDGYKLWAGQRVFFACFRFILGILLLSDVFIKATYPTVYEFPIASAGLSPLNTSIVNTFQFNETAVVDFWWYFPAFLTDTKRAKPVASLDSSCTNDQCSSYFVPGSMASVQLDPSVPVIAPTDYPNAYAWMQIDAPGYQLDFSPIAETNMTTDDCRVFGISSCAVQICLANHGPSLQAAWNPCPSDVRQNNGCLNTNEWRTVVPFNTQLTISERRASTVFDRYNFSIIDIIDLSDPTPTIYTPNDFFTFYEIIFNVDETQQNWWVSCQYMFLLGIVSYLGDNVGVQNGTGSEDRLSRLQEFLATPIFLFNNVAFGGPLPGLGKSAALAIPSYRLMIAPYTLYSFFAGGVLTLIWCLSALFLSMMTQTPNTSLFPEIAFAAKIERTQHRRYGLPPSLLETLEPLNNSGSIETRRHLSSERIYVRLAEDEMEENRSIVVKLHDNGLPLVRRGYAPDSTMI